MCTYMLTRSIRRRRREVNFLWDTPAETRSTRGFSRISYPPPYTANLHDRKYNDM